MADDEVPAAAPMSLQEAEKYKTELRNELSDLEFAQAMRYSDYKRDRINRLRGRLGITVD